MFYFNSLFCNVNTQTKITVYIMVLNILIAQLIFSLPKTTQASVLFPNSAETVSRLPVLMFKKIQTSYKLK